MSNETPVSQVGNTQATVSLSDPKGKASAVDANKSDSQITTVLSVAAPAERKPTGPPLQKTQRKTRRGSKRKAGPGPRGAGVGRTSDTSRSSGSMTERSPSIPPRNGESSGGAGGKTPKPPSGGTGGVGPSRGPGPNAPTNQPPPPSGGSRPAPGPVPGPTPPSGPIRDRKTFSKLVADTWDKPDRKNLLKALCKRATFSHKDIQSVLMIENSKLPISVISPAQEAVVKEFGFKFQYKPAGDTSTHGIAQVCRKIAQKSLMILIAGDVHEGNCKRVVDMYGSIRFLSHYHRACSPRKPVVDVEAQRPRLTAKDFVGYINPAIPVDLMPTDLLVYTDVYITPSEVLDDMVKGGCSKCYFLVTDHDPRYEAGSMFKNEAFWYNDKGKIVHFSGVGESPWYPTEFIPQWFTDTHCTDTAGNTLVWNAHRRFLNYTLFQVRCVQEAIPLLAPPIARPRPSDVLIEKKRLPDERNPWDKFLGMFRDDPYNRDLYVFVPALEALETSMTNRTRQGYQLSALTSEVNAIMSKQQYAPFWRVYGKQAQVASDTVHYMTWANIKRDVDNHVAGLRAHGKIAEFFKSIRSVPKALAEGTPDRVPIWLVVLGGIVTLALSVYTGVKLQIRAGKTFDLDDLKSLVKTYTNPLNVFSAIVTYLRTLIGVEQPKIATPEEIQANVSIAMAAAANAVVMTMSKRMGYAGVTLLATAFLRSPSVLILGILKALLPEAVVAGLSLPLLVTSSIYEPQNAAAVVAMSGYIPMSVSKKDFGWICIGAPLMEEAIKRFVPARAYGAFEGVLHALGTFPYLTDMDPLGKATVLSSKMLSQSAVHDNYTAPESYVKSVLCHMSWNISVCDITPIGRVAIAPLQLLASFIDRRFVPSLAMNLCLGVAKLCYDGSVSPTVGSTFSTLYPIGQIVEEEEDEMVVRNLTPETAILPANRIFRGYEKYADEFGLAHDLYDSKPDTTFVYELLTTTAQFTRPNGIYHMLKAIITRNLCEVPITSTCEGDEPCKYHIARVGKSKCPIGIKWTRLERSFLRNLQNHFRRHYTKCRIKRRQWANEAGGAAKKRRAHDGIDHREAGDMKTKSDLFLKGDEVLRARPDGFKGRTIKAISPTVQAELAPYIARAMKYLKRIFNENEKHHIGEWEFTFSVGSGRLAEDLDGWFEKSLSFVTGRHSRVAAIFAGDDLYFMANIEGKISVVESDMGKFDRTQGVHALAFEMKVLEALEVPTNSTHLLMKAMLSVATYEEKYLDIKLKVAMPPQRATGAPDTTLGNTITNMGSMFHFLMTNPPDKGFDTLGTVMLELGFVANAIVRPFGFQATFLKGWWMPDEEGRARWLPLPSQVIKLGKILTNPKEIYPREDSDTAWRMAAVSIAKGVGHVPFEYPILGPFLEKYRSLEQEFSGKQSASLKIIIEQQHKVRREAGNFKLDVAMIVQEFGERYGLVDVDIRRVETLFREAPFPARLHDPVFEIIARVDYS